QRRPAAGGALAIGGHVLPVDAMQELQCRQAVLESFTLHLEPEKTGGSSRKRAELCLQASRSGGSSVPGTNPPFGCDCPQNFRDQITFPFQSDKIVALRRLPQYLVALRQGNTAAL